MAIWRKLFGKRDVKMAQTMQANDEFICGKCGATSTWSQRYYQDITPDTPFPRMFTFDDWDKVEHYRVFCPKCGALVADRLPSGMGWVDRARPVEPDKWPGETGQGGEWIPPVQAFRSNLVPFGKRNLDIERLKQTWEAVKAKEQAIRTMSMTDLFRRLRNSKGKVAGDIEGELKARGEDAVPQLIEALRDPEVYLRWRVCYVLAEMGQKAAAARPALEIALKDTEESVRSGAGDALARIPKT